jgi:hypothetical protein
MYSERDHIKKLLHKFCFLTCPKNCHFYIILDRYYLGRFSLPSSQRIRVELTIPNNTGQKNFTTLRGPKKDTAKMKIPLFVNFLVLWSKTVKIGFAVFIFWMFFDLK